MTKSKVKIRKPYDAPARHSMQFPEKTMAKQSFKEECDINTIMAKYQKTGLIEHVQNVQAQYGDFTSVADYQLSLNQVIAAQNAFEQLPSRVRERFSNDPSRLMAFLEDDKNRDEAVRLGLIEPTPSPPQPEAPTGASEAPAGADPATKEPKAPAAQ